jgi:glycosyltransferase involved in cell wall biosynthesis
MNETPLVSLVILAYNQENFISEAINGALSQTYDNLEIIVSDDYSTDNTYEIARQTIEKYNGDKKIYLYRNEKNIGLVPHVNKIFSQYVNGEYIALAGGDDISLPERIEKTVALFKNDSVYAVSGQCYVINEKGNVIGNSEQNGISYCEINDEYIKNLSFMTSGAGLAIKKCVLDKFGELELKTPTEDSTLRFRSLLLGKLAVSDHYFIKYRRHDNNLTNHIYSLKTKYISKQYIVDLKKAYERNIIDNNLYQRLRKKVFLYGLNRDLSSWKNGKSIFVRLPLRFVQEVVKKTIRWV